MPNEEHSLKNKRWEIVVFKNVNSIKKQSKVMEMFWILKDHKDCQSKLRDTSPHISQNGHDQKIYKQ